MMLLVLFILFILLDMAALRWGYDSRDSIDSVEWAHHTPGGAGNLGGFFKR